VVNLKSDWDPFTIQRFTGGNVYDSELTPYSVFCTWNHWPTAQIPSDGRYASFPDRAGHSSLTHVKWDYFKKQPGDAPYVMKTLLEGMSNLKPAELFPLAKSWLSPAPLEAVSGCTSDGYDQSQKAYVLMAGKPSLSFIVAGSENSPIENPCFVIHGWKSGNPAVLFVDGKSCPAGSDFRQGTVIDTEGELCMVIWLKHRSSSPMQVTISGARPGNKK
jgi:hypothetical protein